jgi:hypothetical protein
MMKVKVRKVGTALIGAATMMAAAGCATTVSDDTGAPREVQIGSASGAYSVQNPGSALLTFNGTYGGYEFELSVSTSSTDEFIRSGESLTINFPAYYIWQALHPDNYEEPDLARVQQTSAKVQVFYFKDGEPVGSATVTAGNWSGDAYWILYAATEAFVVPAGVDQVKFAVQYIDAGDTSAVPAPIDASRVRPLTVFGGDLPDKSLLFDAQNGELRQRMIEGGGPVTGADLVLGYTDWRADTVVDAMKLDRQIGTYKASTRFGLQIQPIYGQVVHEVSVGVFFDDGQGWRAEAPMTPNGASQFVQQQSWRTIFESKVAIPNNATQMKIYYHVKTYLVANYNVYGEITWKKYGDGEKILLAERWDNPSGPSSNYDVGVEASEGNPELRRTVVFVRGETQPGQDMFLRGGIDHAQAEKNGLKCVSSDNTPNYKCAIPIVHRNHKNAGTNPWKPGDKFLDWYGHESTQLGTSQNGLLSQGSPADWTTNVWPADFGAQKTVEQDGYGVEPLNNFGMHYWMLDVDMDCSRAYLDAQGNRWVEIKSFISNGPGWEPDVKQAGAPYQSANHFAQCGKVSVFERGTSSAQFFDLK